MSRYNDLIKKARRKQFELSLEQEYEIIKIYEEAADNISNRIKTTNNRLNKYILKGIRKEIDEELRYLRNRLYKNIKSGMNKTAALPIEAQFKWLESVITDIDIDLDMRFHKSFSIISNNVVQLLTSNEYYSDRLTLDDRLWNLISKNSSDIDKLYKQSIAEQLSVRELSERLEQYVNPRKILKTKTKIKGLNNKVAYQAIRLARTSGAHAFNEATIQSANYMDPFIKGVKWNLSKNHYERMRRFSKAGSDICDKEYASHDEGIGKGVYSTEKPENIPVDHPNGLCYLTTVVVSVKETGERLKSWRNGSPDYKMDLWYQKWQEEIING